MRSLFAATMCICVALLGYAQEEGTRIDITGFEDGLEWSYSGENITGSFVDFSPIPPNDVIPPEGENALVVQYSATGQWNWSQLDFPQGALDLTGMREIHMMVYFSEDWQGQTDIRLDLPGGIGLGVRDAATTGEWVELVWEIDRINSEKISEVSNLGGFIAPGDETAQGTLYIDDIYAYRPAGVPEVETQLLYGFNELNPDTGMIRGWEDVNGAGLLGMGDVEPAEGDNYMEIALGDGWTENVSTVSPMDDFDRWEDVVDIQVSARMSEGFTGSWAQYVLVLQSGIDGVENPENVNGWDQLPEQGVADATDSWKNVVWQVDMSNHSGAFENEGGWFDIVMITNNDGAVSGQLAYLDNFRIGVKVQDTDVSNWNLF